MPAAEALELALVGYGGLTVLCLALVTWRYRSLFHPLLLPGLQLGIMACLAPLAQDVAHSLKFPPEWWLEACGLTALYLLAFTWPFLIQWNPALPAVATVLGPLEVPRQPVWRFPYRVLAGLGIGASIVFFGLLLRDSPAGWQWFFDPRGAYIQGRAGVGHWYVMSQAVLFLSCLIWLYYGRPRRISSLLVIAGCYGIAMAWFGSKAGMVAVIAAVGVYFNFYVREIRREEFAGALLVGLPLILISPWLQGSFSTLKETLQYYDYFDNGALYLGRAEHFGPQWGGSLLSSLWEYVPRRFYPDKPFVYGNVVFNEQYWPGAAEEGYTPGWLPWVSWHMDWGVGGVLLGGLLAGFVSKGVYTHFLRSRSFPAFLAFLQTCFLPVLKHAPAAYFVLLLVCLSAGLIVWTRACQLAWNGVSRWQIRPTAGKGCEPSP